MHRLFLSVLLAAVPLAAEAPRVLAIRNARVVPVSGPVVEQGHVVVRDGLIEEAGANASIPPDAWVVEGAGLTVYPGLINALSTWGLEDAPAPAVTTGRSSSSRNPAVATPPATVPSAAPAAPVRGAEDRPATTTWLRAADLIRTTDRRIELARNQGFTAAVVFPRTGIFAGEGAIVNLAGERAPEMIVLPSAGQYVSLRPGSSSTFPGSLMGVIAYVRQLLLDAEHYRASKALYAKGAAGRVRPEYDRALEGLLQTPRIVLPASRDVEVQRMLRFAGELKLKPVLYGVQEGYRSAERLAQAGVPALVNLRWPERPRDADPEEQESLRSLTLRDTAPSSPAALARAGVKFAFYADAIERPADIPRAVKKAMEAGLSSSDAVRALTLAVAEIYGVSDRLGSIEKGKIANLTVTRGDLFEEGTKVEFVVIDGRKFEPAPEPREAASEAR